MHYPKLYSIAVIAGVTALACLAPPAPAQLDGEHPAFRVDAQRTGRSTYTGADDSLIKWNASLGGILQSSPAIAADGTIYVGSFNQSLHAVNRNGTVKWTYPTSGWISSSPAIGHDGTVFVGSEDNNLHAVNPDGTTKWKYWTGRPPGVLAPVYTSPVVTSSNVLLFTSDRGTVFANDAETGASLWTVETSPYSLSSPAIGHSGAVYIGSASGDLYAIDPNGTVAWTFHTGNKINSTPAVGDDGTIYVTSTDGKCYAVNPDGTQKWAYSTLAAIGSSPTIGYDGTIYFGGQDGYFHAINGATGARKWIFAVGQSLSSSATVDIDNNVFFGGTNGYVYSLDANGNQRWRANIGAAVYSSPAIDSFGTIYVGTTQGNLIAIGDAVQSNPAPEPSTIILALLAAPGAVALARRRRKS